MEPPILKLTMVRGPREGETLEFRPGSTVRIGRVVRGNNISIKDAGISSKHLVIVSESGKWSLQDLDSSNGTTLNSTMLSPYKSFDLRDGDTIKLGELTSILVQINVHEETSQLRRNPRRRVNESSKVGSVAANRSRRGNEEEGKNAETLKEEKVEKLEEKIEVIVVPEVKGKGRPRKAKALEKVESAVPAEAKRVNLRSTRSRKNENEDCVVLENLGVDCGEMGKKVRGGRGRKNNLQEVPAESVQCDVVDDKENVDIGMNVQEEAKEVANEAKIETPEGEKIEKKEVDFGEKCKDTVKRHDAKEGDRSEARASASGNLKKQKELQDLEKMTLEEWFDCMEVDLPKQVLEATEEMIEAMRRKAERVREYMIEQKKNQGVGTVG